MKVHIGKLKRLAYGAVGVGFLALVAAPLFGGSASALTGGQLTNRSIALSDATPGDNGNTYTLSFTPASNYTVEGIIIDFCSSNPIIGNATCTHPAGIDVKATPTVNASPTYNGNTNLGGTWTPTGLNNSTGYRTVKLENSTGVAITTGNTYSISITGVDNPDATGTFYARVITYTQDSGDIDSYAAGTEGNTEARDYGGIALATASAINISATVQESLTFCTSDGGSAPGSACSGTAAPIVALGTATTPPILDASAVYTDTAYHQLTSNASSGVDVRLKVNSPYTCAGLSRDGGTTCTQIPAAGALAAIVAGTAEFGLRVADGTGGTGAVNGDAAYEHGSTDYAMVEADVTSTWGDVIHTSSGATTNVNSVLTYGATASATTPAGVYSTVHNLIATGKF